jgi:hypothetical protein
VSDRKWRDGIVVGLLCSAVLHGLILALWFVLTREPKDDSAYFPVEIALADQTASPQQPVEAIVPQQKAGAPSSPAAEPRGATPSNKRPDDLEIKLHTLAKLRQPSLDTHLSERNTGLSRMSATSDDAATGSYATNAVRDFIRAQVERRWSLDLSTLGSKNFSVLIRIEITSAGVINRAEVVENATFNADKVYRAVAFSARNAVLLSSPVALPSGHYNDVMDFTLDLSTKEALR